MHWLQKKWVIAVLVIIVLVGGILWYKGVSFPAFPINAKDTIVSWSFQGAYTGNDTLIAQANADIEHLESLLGKGDYDDYDLYIGMGNDSDLIGDGARAYKEFNRAASIHTDRGLAYANIAHLMDQLGAPYTAADAYAKAVAAEPGQLQYTIERLNYLVRQFPQDTERIEAAIADSETQFGKTSQMLAIKAGWLESLQKYADAIAAWQEAKEVSPSDAAAINAEIARLRAKQ
jgi:tetratricopeptide (TPR) repeat protein